MRRSDGRAAALLLLLLCPTLFAASFSECFPRERLARFWESPSYEGGNPYIRTALFLKFYSYSFDSAAQSSSAQNLSLLDGGYLLSHLPQQQRREFATVSSALDSAQASTAASKTNFLAAHSLSLSAQEAAKIIFSDRWILLFGNQWMPAVLLIEMAHLARVLDISGYMALYHLHLWPAYSGAADAYESLNLAASESAGLADGKLQALRKAGAASPHYSGKAKGALFESEAQLLPSSLCAMQGAPGEIAGYFSASPHLPDLSATPFGSYLRFAAGSGEQSAIVQLARAYAKLSAAEEAMQSEYHSAHLAAQQSVRLLSSGVSLLEKERLDLIGEGAMLQGGDFAQVGSAFAGIYGGLKQARQELAKSQSELSVSESSRSSPNSEGYLADAIYYSQEAEKTASAALESLSRVKESAEASVEYRRNLAQAAIEKAEAAASQPPSAFTDAQAYSESQQFLSGAKESFKSAASKATLGERYAAYAKATEYASKCMLRAERQISLPLRSLAHEQLISLSETIRSAKKDGLDTEYEETKLKEYITLFSSTSSPESLRIIENAAQGDRRAILLSLYEKYAHLEQQHAETEALVSEIRKHDSLFLRESDALSDFFIGGKLNVEAASGRLSQLAAQVASHLSQARERLPSHLSEILSRNSESLELFEQPTLGRISSYSATILSRNPSQFSHNGTIDIRVPSALALLPQDFMSGDEFSDVFSDGGAATIRLFGIGAGQALSFSFEKQDAPAQTLSSREECGAASQEQAAATRKISFFASRALPSLLIAEQAPPTAQGAQAAFSGRRSPLSITYVGNLSVLSGEIAQVQKGENSLEISYHIPFPYSVSQGARSSESASPGSSRVSYELEISGPQLDCASASAYITEPFTGISNLSVVPLGPHKVSQAKATPQGQETRISFTFSPLQKGGSAHFFVSYSLYDEDSALSGAFSQAELQVLFYNRTQDEEALALARSLHASGRNAEALYLLSKMRQEAALLSLQPPSGAGPQSESASASQLLQSALATQQELGQANLTEASAALSAIAYQLQSDLSGAPPDFAKALETQRKAAAKFRSSLALLAFESSEEAAAAYAKARKSAGDSLLLDSAQQELRKSQLLFSSGEHLSSYFASSRALWMLSSLSDESAVAQAQSQGQLALLKAEFSSLQSETEQLLSKYSAQYSALSGQSKKRLPITPSDAQKRMEDAQKSLASAEKKGSLSGANQSLQKLAAAGQSVQQALDSLQQSSASSLEVARLALSEARQKSGAQDAQDLAQIEAEVSRAEGYFSESLFADSLMASDRAIAASNALLSKKGGGIDSRSILLAAVSIAFIGAAAYYFSRGRKRGGEEKKDVKRED